MNKAIFLDRDGIINKIIVRENEYISSPRKFEEFVFIDGINELLLKLKEKNYLAIIITNQPEIFRGLLEMEELERMHKAILEILTIDDIFMCFHDNQHNCECRKPKPGMLLQAAKKWDIDLSESFILGDSAKDIESGKRAWCNTILLETQYNINNEINPHFRIKSILEAFDIISDAESDNSLSALKS